MVLCLYSSPSFCHSPIIPVSTLYRGILEWSPTYFITMDIDFPRWNIENYFLLIYCVDWQEFIQCTTNILSGRKQLDIKSDFPEKNKILLSCSVSLLVYVCRTSTITKQLEKKLGGNYTNFPSLGWAVWHSCWMGYRNQWQIRGRKALNFG